MVISLYLEHATLRPLLMEVRLWSMLKEALLESHASTILCLGEKMKWCLKEVANEVLLGGFDALKVHLEQHDILRENRAVGINDSPGHSDFCNNEGIDVQRMRLQWRAKKCPLLLKSNTH
jgi:hypothetical protein